LSGALCPGTRGCLEADRDFIHAESEAKVCMQIGHAGAKGSTQLGWEIMDAPLKEGNWPLMSASDVAWSSDNQTPKAMTARTWTRSVTSSSPPPKWPSAPAST
jgi:anthraniloyl-CoA monooxygenase